MDQVKDKLVSTLGIGLFLLVWQIGAFLYGSIILPSPMETIKALFEIVQTEQLLWAIGATTAHAFVGFGLALMGGCLLGGLAALQPTVRQALWPVVTILQGIPPIAWIVLATIWFGNSGITPVFTVAVATFPLVFIGTMEGVQAVDQNLLEMIHIFKAGLWIRLTDLYIPHLIPFLFPIIIAGLGVAWKVAVMSELLATDSGIGAGLYQARVNLDIAEALAWIVLVVILMFSFEYLVLHPLKRWLEPWRNIHQTQTDLTSQGFLTITEIFSPKTMGMRLGEGDERLSPNKR